MMIINNKTLTFISLVLTVVGLVACSPKNTTVPNETETLESTKPPEAQETVVFGDISDNPQKKIRRFQPLVNYLAANSSQFDRGKVKIAPDMETMIAWLKSGEVDVYIDSPYPAMLAMNGAGAKPILRRWKDGSSEYHSLIFTMSDRNITSLSDLAGKTIAFDDPFSTTGYMLPLAKLSESRLNPIEKSMPNTPVAEDAVGYVFTSEDENSIEWLLSERVAAAAVDNISFDELSSEIKEQAVVLAETEKVARNLVLVRGDMPPEQIEAISSVLLEMDKTAGGKTALETFEQTSKFEKFPSAESLNRIQELYQTTQNQ